MSCGVLSFLWPSVFPNRLSLTRQHYLTHLPLNKMAIISQKTVSYAFSWMISFFLFWFEFHWSLFPMVQLNTPLLLHSMESTFHWDFGSLNRSHCEWICKKKKNLYDVMVALSQYCSWNVSIISMISFAEIAPDLISLLTCFAVRMPHTVWLLTGFISLSQPDHTNSMWLFTPDAADVRPGEITGWSPQGVPSGCSG